MKEQELHFFHSIFTSAPHLGQRPGMNTLTGIWQVLSAGRLSGVPTFTAHQAVRMNPTLLQDQNRLMQKRKPTGWSDRHLQQVMHQLLDGIST